MSEACHSTPANAGSSASQTPDANDAPETAGGSPGIEIFASELNGALNRLPKVHCLSLPVDIFEATSTP